MVLNCLALQNLTTMDVWQGVWVGIIMGTAVQTGILVWMTCITDWDKQVSTIQEYSSMDFIYHFIFNSNDFQINLHSSFIVNRFRLLRNGSPPYLCRTKLCHRERSKLLLRARDDADHELVRLLPYCLTTDRQGIRVT